MAACVACAAVDQAGAGPGPERAEPWGQAEPEPEPGVWRERENCAQTRSGLCGLLTSVSESCDQQTANITSLIINSHSSVSETDLKAEDIRDKAITIR